MPTHNLRVVVRFLTLLMFVFALSLAGWASSLNQGSTVVNRTSCLGLSTCVDSVAGGVYIYAGGNFTNGETVTVFNWFDAGLAAFTGSSDLTPLLLTTNGSGTYTVVGIGGLQTVDGSGAQTAAFGLIAGSNLVSGTNWTFGFLEGGVSSTGSVTSTTAGGIPFDTPIDAGTGVGGAGTTNDWVFTPTGVTTVAINTTFGANGTFALNNPGLGGFNQDRTYSANAGISGVAEPGTFSLITGAGLILAGLFRYRARRNS